MATIECEVGLSFRVRLQEIKPNLFEFPHSEDIKLAIKIISGVIGSDILHFLDAVRPTLHSIMAIFDQIMAIFDHNTVKIEF